MLVAAVVASAGDDALKPGSELKSDGAIAGAPQPAAEGGVAGGPFLPVAAGKNATVLLDLGAKFDVRVDRAVKRGPVATALFTAGKPITILGRPSRLMQNAADPNRGLPRIAPHHAVVLGEGFAPKDVLPAAKEKLGDKVQWFHATVDRVEGPDRVWVRSKEEKEILALDVGRDDRVLTTRVAASKDLADGVPALRAALAKGQPVRFRGTVKTVLYTDPKGKLVDDADRRKAGVKAEIYLTPTRLVLLDATFAYGFVETAESD